jgi:hypothetical protein
MPARASGTARCLRSAYRVVAAEQRGAKVKKKLEIDPLHADTVRLAFRLALEGGGASGPKGVLETVLDRRQERTERQPRAYRRVEQAGD